MVSPTFHPSWILCRRLLSATLVAVCCHADSVADVVPHALFSSHAVLPRDVELPVWGSAAEGERVEVSFAGQTVATTAREGRWQVRLQPLRASADPAQMTIRGESNQVVLTDVLVGDVWLCSGQSNMEWPLAKSSQGKQVAAGARNDRLRFFQVPKRLTAEATPDGGGSWTRCDPRSASRFSAVGYYFGRDLAQTVRVPIGLLQASVSATPAEYWISPRALQAHPKLAFLPERHRRSVAAYDPARAKAAYEAALEAHRLAVEKALASGKKPPRPPSMAGNPRHRGPSCAYQGMIHPLVNFPIRGVIWYQGESNRSNPGLYASLFPTLIADWRQAWNRPQLPFLFVQLAPFDAIPPELREIQTQVWQATSHTAMVVTTDCGSAKNIHPPQKEPVGKRLALAARAVVYGESITWSGPVVRKVEFRGDQAIVHFGSTGRGLRPLGDATGLVGFTLAGADGKHFPARATLHGADAVWLTCPEVPKPAAVRYGWDRVPVVNLANSNQLPAVPFRTDPPTFGP